MPSWAAAPNHELLAGVVLSSGSAPGWGASGGLRPSELPKVLIREAHHGPRHRQQVHIRAGIPVATGQGSEWHPAFLQLAPTLEGCARRYQAT